MDRQALTDILEKHSKWLRGDSTGSRADLSRANLRSADLSRADLSRANLRNADLRSANLRSAVLSGADLSGAVLKDTILAGINWLAYIGIIPDGRGKARAYKMTTATGEGPTYPGINYADSKTVEVDDIDRDVNVQCGRGVNLATFAWCLNERQEGYRLFLMEFTVSSDNLCCPTATDGKFRVKQAKKIGECDWQGNLLPKPATAQEG